MADSAGYDALHLTGDLTFLNGGLRVENLIGFDPALDAAVAPQAARLTALDTAVTNLQAGRLHYTWRFALGFRSQVFDEGDFMHLLLSAASDFPQLVAPEFTEEDTFFGGIAIPLSAPLAGVVRGTGFSARDLLTDTGFYYRRVPEPLFIMGVPHRVYVSRYHLTRRSDSGAELTLTPRPKVAAYPRYAIATVAAAAPAFDDSWNKSYSPVIALGDFGGVARHVHVLLPHGTVPDPTLVMASVDGAANVAGAFMRAAGLYMIDGVPYAVRSSGPLQPADYTNRDLIVLPQRDGVRYYEAPTTFPPQAVAFTWYMGFYATPADVSTNWYMAWKATNDFTAADFLAGTAGAYSSQAFDRPTGGGNQYLAFARKVWPEEIRVNPSGLSNDPNDLSIADFTEAGATVEINGETFVVGVSTDALDTAHFTDSGTRSVVFFTGFQAVNPITDALAAQLIADGTAVASQTNQITPPADSDGGEYRPDQAFRYGRFMLQPLSAPAIEGLAAVPTGVTYDPVSDLRNSADWWPTSGVSTWTRQATNVTLNGVEHIVWLNRSTTRAWQISLTQGTFVVFRAGDGYGE